MHVSTVPILAVTWIKNVGMGRKALIIGFGGIIVIAISDSAYASYIIAKFTRYAETGSQRDSLNLLIFHIFNIFLFIYFAVIDSKFRKNSAVISMMGIYFFLYLISPVMGLRMFPFVLIACIGQRISLRRHRSLTLVIITCLLPIYFFRFEQILL